MRKKKMVVITDFWNTHTTNFCLWQKLSDPDLRDDEANLGSA